MIDLIGVESSMISAAGYEPETRTLVVLFTSGKAYEYLDVPPEVYEELMAAESKGQYMNSQVIDVYEYRPFKRGRK